jgi:hypothetical protein
MDIRNLKGTAYAVGMVASFGIVASADAALVATLTGYGAGRYQECGFDSSLAWNSNAAVTMASIRAYQHEMSTSSGQQILTWCTEIYQGLDVGTAYTFNEVAAENAPGGAVAPGPMGAIKATAVRDLFARWIDLSTGYVNGSAEDRDAKSAAFQVVVWEITHENFSATTASGIVAQMSLSSGAFRSNLSGASAGWYTQMVQSLGVGGFQSTAIGGMTNDFAQDQLRLVPAPGAIALLGLAGFASRRRR